MVLVIEDDVYILKAINKIFDINDIEGIYVSNGLAALDVLNNQKDIDLILCDIQLPDIDGYEILSRVKSNPELLNIPFVFLTAFADPNDVRRGMNMGADDYITKPFSAKILVDAVKSRIKLSKFRATLLNKINKGTLFNVLNNNFNHEFLTPLNGILNSVSIIQDTEIKPDYQTLVLLLNNIKSAGYRMLNNTQKLMLYSLLTSDSVMYTAEKKTISISELIDSIVEEKKLSSSNNIVTTIEQFNLTIDHKEHLEFIIKELIDNAYKHSKKDTTIEVAFEKTDDTYCFSVENEVNEFNEDFTIDNIAIFHKFHNDQNLSGFGIGLFLCKELITKLGYEFNMHHDSNKIKFTLKFNSPDND